MPAHPPARHPEPAQCPSRPPCSPSTRLGISKDHEVAASVHADTPNPGEPVTTEQQPHTPLPWTRTPHLTGTPTRAMTCVNCAHRRSTRRALPNTPRTCGVHGG